MLGEIIHRASGQTYDAFARQYLLQPLGISDFVFAKTPAGEIDSGGHLRLRPRDFAKIALLMQNKGVWEGQRIVPESWVAACTTPHVVVTRAKPTSPYMGYLWWESPVVNGEVRSYQARGNGGQFLIVVPGENLIGVFTGSAFNMPLQMQPFYLMKKYIIPAWKP